MTETMGDRIRKIRKAQGITLQEMQNFGISTKGHLSEIETNKNKNPNVNELMEQIL